MNPRLTDEAQKEIERMWALRQEAVHLLGLVVAEWRSDPQSVACFDSRVVERAKTLIAEIEPLLRKHVAF